MISYEIAEDVKEIAYDIVKTLNMDWIDLKRVHFVRSYGSKSNAYARCYGLSRIWQFVLKEKPHYIIEVISENFDGLKREEKIKIIIHELLHIPKKFSGGLRTHRYVTRKRVLEYYREYKKKKLKGRGDK